MDGAPILGRSREDLIRARASAEASYDPAPFLEKQEARDAELQARANLRRQRGVERGEAWHQARLQNILNPPQQVSPLMAVLMQRRPEVAAQMVLGNQRNSLLARQLGMEDQQAQARLGLAGRRLAQDAARDQQHNSLLAQQLGLSDRQFQARLAQEDNQFNAQQSLLARQLGMDDQHHQAQMDLQRQQLEANSGLTGARADLARAEAERQAAETALLNDPDRQAREERMANAERLMSSTDPALAQQGARMLAEVLDVPDPLTSGVVDPETGDLDSSSVARVAQHLWDSGLTGQDAIDEAERLGVPQSELYRFAENNSPGMIGRFWNRVDERFRGDRARAENFREQAPVMNLRDALGMPSLYQ